MLGDARANGEKELECAICCGDLGELVKGVVTLPILVVGMFLGMISPADFFMTEQNRYENAVNLQ